MNQKLKLFFPFILIVSCIFLSSLPVQAANKNKIHFLPTGGSDAILLESNGKFALIDGAEDSDNPRKLPALASKGYEQEVLNYIKKVASDANGNVTLDFIVGTHAHSDHLGGLDTVILDPKIKVKKAFIKKYDSSKIIKYEIENWDNREVYNQTINALKYKKIEIVQNMPKNSFKLNDLSIQIFNGEYDNTNVKKGENANSLGVKISKGSQSIFLAGDIGYSDGDEVRLAPQIGKVTLLKLGHHGLPSSSSKPFLTTLKPKYVIATNNEKGIDLNVRQNVSQLGIHLYSTMKNNGIIISLDSSDLGLNKYSLSNLGWVYINNNWYYLDSNSTKLKGWQKLIWNNKSDWYYFGNDGVMKNGWLCNNKKWYYLNEKTNINGINGAMLKGWQKLTWNNKENWYYFDDSGSMVTGRHYLEKNGHLKWYLFNSSGQLS